MGDHNVTSREAASREAAGRPVCHWVAVSDAQGRTRMEARWTAPSAHSTSYAA